MISWTTSLLPGPAEELGDTHSAMCGKCGEMFTFSSLADHTKNCPTCTPWAIAPWAWPCIIAAVFGLWWLVSAIIGAWNGGAK